MKYGTGLQYFYRRFPERFYDVGIAEQHAVTFAGGLASMGMIPVFAVYSSFLQRSYDQLVHDVSIGNLHVTSLGSTEQELSERTVKHIRDFSMFRC